MVVVLRLRKWEFESPYIPLPMYYSGPEIGFLGVYATMEDAVKAYPDGPFITIQEVQPEASCDNS